MWHPTWPNFGWGPAGTVQVMGTLCGFISRKALTVRLGRIWHSPIVTIFFVCHDSGQQVCWGMGLHGVVCCFCSHNPRIFREIWSDLGLIVQPVGVSVGHCVLICSNASTNMYQCVSLICNATIFDHTYHIIQGVDNFSIKNLFKEHGREHQK